MPRFQVMAGPKLERLTEESSVVQSGIRHQLQLKLLTAKTNNITTDHLATSPGLGFTIHSDLPVPNEEFRFAAASSQSLELQDFVELNRLLVYFNCVHQWLRDVSWLRLKKRPPTTTLHIVYGSPTRETHIFQEDGGPCRT